jgi:hypothetical protein
LPSPFEISYRNREGGVLKVNRNTFTKSSSPFPSRISTLALAGAGAQRSALLAIAIQISVGDETRRRQLEMNVASDTR